ncbi:MAG: protein kinase [candidate division Zixibacteria bacterium]|nr:protein kinase [candidate division Zixibacteria bacterium]
MAPNHNDDGSTRSYTLLRRGTLVSSYRIIERIGYGGVGEVYRAEDTKLSRQVAIKFLLPGLGMDVEWRARFEREAQSAAALNHPNIVTIHDISEYQGRPFIVMELVEGETLREIIHRRGPTIDDIVDVALQLCRGLGEAHQAGIIHRDIKPNNIKIDKNGRVRILDFGLAKMHRLTDITKTGSTLGTISYMSPEQALGEELDNRSDIFSLGIVLYEMAHSCRPFQGETEAAVLNAIINKDPEQIAGQIHTIPEKLSRIIAKALQKKWENRYQDIAEMARDLQKLKASLKAAELTASRKPWSVLKPIAITLGITALVLIALQQFAGEDTGPLYSTALALAPQETRIAVLPFENLSDDRENDYVSHSFSKELHAKLKYNSQLRLLAYEQFLDNLNPQVQKELLKKGKADYTVSGQIDQVGSAYEITFQLVEVTTNTVVKKEHCPVADLARFPTVQDQIIADITSYLGYGSVAEPANPFGYQSLSPQTQGLLRKGEFLLDKGEPEIALQVFEQAKEREPARFIIDYFLGLACEKLGRYREAIGHFKLSLTESRHSKIVETVISPDSFDYIRYDRGHEQRLWLEKRLADQATEITWYDYTGDSAVWEVVFKDRPAMVFIAEGAACAWGSTAFSSSAPDTGRIVGLSPENGEIVWQFTDTLREYYEFSWNKWDYEIDDLLHFTDRIHSREVFFDLSTGAVVYERSYQDDPSFSEVRRYNLLDSVLILSFTGKNPRSILAININSGEEIWSLDSTWLRILDNGQAIFFRKSTGEVTAIDIATGETVWSYGIDFAEDSIASVVSRDDQVLVFHENQLTSLRRNTGLLQSRRQWSISFDADRVSPVSWSEDFSRGTILLRSKSGAFVWLVDLTEGRILKQIDASALLPAKSGSQADTGAVLPNIAVSASGDTLLFQMKGELILFDAVSERVLARLDNPTSNQYLRLGSNVYTSGHHLLIKDRNLVHVFDLNRNVKVMKYQYPDDRIDDVFISPTGSATMIGYAGIVRIHLSELPTGAILAQQVYNRIADNYRRLDDYESALKYLDIVERDYDPSDVDMNYQRLLVEVERGNWVGALDVLRQSYELIKEYPQKKEKVISILQSRFNLDWIMEVNMRKQGSRHFQIARADSLSRELCAIYPSRDDCRIISISAAEGNQRWET